MNVELIAYTQPVDQCGDKNPISIVERAASICYNSEPTDTYKIAKGCKLTGHLSVLEHISFTFHISEVSRALLAQLTRHRHCSYSVRSQRYVSEENFEYANPFNDGTEESVFFEDTMKEIAEDYSTLKKMFKVENEDARSVLPNACYTELYFTANARALIEASHLRLCARAQKEIRDMFGLMKQEVNKVAPEIAEWMVPSCEINPKYPFCPEGKRCCGRHKNLSEVYKSDEEEI